MLSSLSSLKESFDVAYVPGFQTASTALLPAFPAPAVPVIV